MGKVKIDKRPHVVRETELSKYGLTERQELFCQYFVSDREFFCNGTQSYIEAYNVDIKKPGKYAAARASSHRLLTNVNILKRIDELLEDAGLNDQMVDKQLSKLITQDADFSAKIAAIKEYNKLRNRITEKMDLTSKGEKITGINITFGKEETELS